MPRKPFTKLLSTTLLLGGTLALFGCKPDLCKEPEYSKLTQRQRCDNCKPKRSKDDEVLARLNPTQLPWPVRRNIEACIDQHSDDLFITKQGLRECIEADAKLDVPTKMTVIQLIANSNVMEQADLENFHAQCSPANLNYMETHVNIQPAAPVVPPSTRFAPPPPVVAPPPPAMPPPSALPPPPVARPLPTPPPAPMVRPVPPPPAAPPTLRPLPPSGGVGPSTLPPPGGYNPSRLPPPGGVRPPATPPRPAAPSRPLPTPPPPADPLL